MNKKRENLLYQDIEITLTSILILLIMTVVTRHIVHTEVLYVICPIFVVVNSLRYRFPEQVKKGMLFIIRWRWVIAGAIFIILVSLGIHGSSMDAVNILSPNDQSSKSNVLFGTVRLIRTDEYEVQVPYFFSQHYNGYQEISHQMSLSGQDMIIGYNSPVLDFTLLGKPFVIGYILFGNNIGLSWYWCSKIILALLVAFEMIRILTKNDEISFLGMFLVVFSPAMQWWFAPHMYDVFFWAMAIFDAGYYFFVANDKKSKILTCILVICTLIGFVVALFPSLQVATGLCVLVLLIACLIRDKQQVSFQRKDYIRLATVLVVVFLVLGHWFLTAKEAIEILSNTAYPGKRISVGGDAGLSVLFTNITSLMTPFQAPSQSNASEVSSFIHLGVLDFLLFPYLWKCNRGDKSLVVGGAFFIIYFVQVIFMLIGFPVWLAKITLFSYINRMPLAYGFSSALFTCWCIAYIVTNRRNVFHWYPVLSLIIFIGLYYDATRAMLDPAYLSTRMGEHIYPLAVIFFGLIGLCLILGWERYLLSFVSSLIIVSGMFVNPICKGISPVVDHDYVKEALAINKKDEGSWITIGTSWEQNILLANGLRTINAVNYYPDLKKWKILDPTGHYMAKYNRYAHISISLSENGTKVTNPAPDAIALTIDAHDISKLGASYVLSTQDACRLLDKNTGLFEKCYSSKGYCIYKVNNQ